MTEKFKAFVLINTDVTHIKKVSGKLLKYKEIENIHELYGQYDIILKLVTDNRIKAEEFIEDKVRHIKGIQGTETLVVAKTIKESGTATTGLNEAEAYILFMVKYGEKLDVSKLLGKHKEVESVHELYGQFDVIAKVKVKTQTELEDFIQKNIRQLKEVEGTETLIVSDVP